MNKKYYKGEKYIYLLMAYRLAKQDKGKKITIGNDNSMVGGQHFERSFRITEHDNKILLTEYKNGRNFAEYTRTFQVGYSLEDCNSTAPAISDYIDEYGYNQGKKWIH